MSKAVLISIRPKWCGKIASGEKTIEVRKAKPKLETPFKCYIYCTRNKHLAFMQNQTGTNLIACMDAETAIPVGGFVGNGKVIGEFVCDKIEHFDSAYSEWAYAVAPPGSVMPMHESKALRLCYEGGCLTEDDVTAYFGDEDWKAYFWHISNLKIYDTPKALEAFTGLRDTKFGAAPYEIKRAPQSWCYVEEQR